MVAIALYRGNLHRVPNTPRRWSAPPRSISASQFKSLLRRRSLALSRLSSSSAAAVREAMEGVAQEREKEKREEETGVEQTERALHDAALSDPTADEPHADPTVDTVANRKENDFNPPVQEEATAPEVAMTEKEERKKELEQKLEELNQKKHNLVQMLKQILNAEEEMKRRVSQSPVTRGPVSVPLPMPSENGPDIPSANRPGPPRMSVEVNFSTDMGGESDPGSTHSAHTRPFYQMQSPSPSGGSLSRSPFSHASRGPQASISILGNPLTSPARFVPATGQHGHASSLPPLLPLPGSNFAMSSPSPAVSGGTPSVFRDSRFGGSS